MFRFFALLVASLAFALPNVAPKQTLSITKTDEHNQTLLEQEEQRKKERAIQNRVISLSAELEQIKQKIDQEKIWTKSYSSYLTSLEVERSLKEIEDKIKHLQRYRHKKKEQKEQLEALIAKKKILTTQLGELKEKGSSPFSELITPPKIENVPEVKNPFDIFSAISFLKTIRKEFESYIQRKNELEKLIQLLKREIYIYQELYRLTKDIKYKKEFQKRQKELDKFQAAYDILVVTADVYKKRFDVIEINLNKGIKAQAIKLANIGITVLVVFFIFFILKLIAKKYIKDNERFYMANKFITFTNFSIILLIIFFNYIENASYLVTILGFASAGIAIAMKDWFMSILGWLVIVFGGSIHVGDRIRVDMDGMKYIGDVLDISLLRITILEDITLTSISHNRRAGRIVFIPNNYIFSRMIANYTHYSLKTVWDGVKITITFDSNHKKAMYIAKEIAKKYSKGYTDITRKQLNKLRHHYSLKNTNVEPRIYSFIEDYGIDIEAWYLTNAYGTLTLRSTISMEIVDAYNAEDDITIAYPTQRISLSRDKGQLKPNDGELV
ncbi:MscS family mechanosensitive ion channel [hydrothermal vent metagenome]|uniref:MscS family mechanosensitive ion channel n=1 Tax=hydrothermal vent metagenome TaxID=652676 RepID=A0A1W1C068_9ZZZZ